MHMPSVIWWNNTFETFDVVLATCSSQDGSGKGTMGTQFIGGTKAVETALVSPASPPSSFSVGTLFLCNFEEEIM